MALMRYRGVAGRRVLLQKPGSGECKEFRFNPFIYTADEDFQAELGRGGYEGVEVGKDLVPIDQKPAKKAPQTAAGPEEVSLPPEAVPKADVPFLDDIEDIDSMSYQEQLKLAKSRGYVGSRKKADVLAFLKG